MHISRTYLISAVLFTLTALMGCQTTNRHLVPISGDKNSIAEYANIDHQTDFSQYRTFAIIDPEDSPDNQLANLHGSTVKYVLTEMLSLSGYRAAKKNETPDMLVVVSGRSDTSSHLVRGQVSYLPVWKPGKTYTYTGMTSGNFNTYSMNTSNNYYGNVTGTTYGTIQESGQMEYLAIKNPDRIVKENLTQITIAAYDTKSKNELVLLRSQAKTFSDNPDLAAQYLLKIMSKFPKNKLYLKKDRANRKLQGKTGLVLISVSLDGASMYPMVRYIKPGSPAESAGAEELDIVLAINGKSVRNIPVYKIYNETETHPGDTIKFTVWRGGKETIVLSMDGKLSQEVWRR